MIRSVMESAGLEFWPILSLVLFTLFALALGMWLFRRDAKIHYERMAELALGKTGTRENPDLDGRR